MSEDTESGTPIAPLRAQSPQSAGHPDVGDMPLLQRSKANIHSGVFWGYLVLITAFEAAIVLIAPQVGIILYVCLLFWLTLHSGLGRCTHGRKLALALTLVPLIRILGLALPLMHMPIGAWYPIITLPLLFAAWVVARQLALSLHLIGLNARNLPFHLMMMSGGIGLGALQFAIFQPAHLVDTGFGDGLLPLAILLIMLASFTEELIFRGLVQTMAWPILQRRALIYSALIFAVLHIGYLSVSVVIFAFLKGLLFAHIVFWCRSIVGVALVHGIASIISMIVLPALIQNVAYMQNLGFWLQAMGMAAPGTILVMLVIMSISMALVLMVLGYLCALH